MAYTKHTWQNNDSNSKLSAENLNKLEEGLRVAAEVADTVTADLSTFRNTEFDKVLSDLSSASTDIESHTERFILDEERITTLETDSATKEELTAVNTPIKTAVVTRSLANQQDPNYYTDFVELDVKNSVPVKVDVSISNVDSAFHNREVPLWSITKLNTTGNYIDAIGVGPGTLNVFQTGTELKNRLLSEHPGALFESVEPEASTSVLGPAITNLDDYAFATANFKLTSSIGYYFSTYYYDAATNFIMICYSPALNKFYILNLKETSLCESLYFGHVEVSKEYQPQFNASYILVNQNQANSGTIKLPADTNLLYFGFCKHKNNIIISPHDDFYYLGDLYTRQLRYYWLFMMASYQYLTHFPLLETGTYYFNAIDELNSNLSENTPIRFVIGNNAEGPNADPVNGYEGYPDLYYLSQFTNGSTPRLSFTFTYPPKASNGVQVLKLLDQKTDADIKQLAKEEFKNLITMGTEDPTAETKGLIYLKYFDN